ncbi:MAG: imidazole glycerol phosphate synthase subunit HisH [Rhodospirillales bacterium]|nr:imidazole glycerol phosphate synthase subunit HisH [Rhodospirillales bacterium]MCW8969771.1 imidazole glycerol phosphate synthase subunit HisH [Rhodospirillales bacterium]MCW9002231.1 imidazole glycerol phosphate synthase subunit HisH [Rhodospirillales bacterium]MCW9040339.1 imidazole glycerol phosphate synthase subunit HisH [Rhodospirillales bacterium]
MSVAIIDYGSGNLRSAAKAFERASHEAGLGFDIVVTDDPDLVAGADRVVLPGVGAFGDCRRGLDAVPGMHEALDEAVLKRAAPFLGICVGMQLMADVGHEHGDHRGLGWISGDVVALKPDDASLKIPHMGWNTLEVIHPHPVLNGMGGGDDAYFVHSYQFVCKDDAHLLARVGYGGSVTAVIGRDNMVGTQFHPEKSQHVGLHLITNFLKWRP